MWTAILATLNLLDGADARRLGGEHRGRVPRGGRGRRRAARHRACPLTSRSRSSSARTASPGSVEACLEALAPQRDGVEVIVCEATPSAGRGTQRVRVRRDSSSVRARSCPSSGVTASTRRRGDRGADDLADGARRRTGSRRSARALAEDEAVGGAIDPGDGLRLVDWAEYFCRYARDMRPFALARERGDLPATTPPTGASSSSATRPLPRRVLGAGGPPRAPRTRGARSGTTPSVVVFQGRSAGFGRVPRGSGSSTAAPTVGSAAPVRRGPERWPGSSARPLVPFVLTSRVRREVFSGAAVAARSLAALPRCLAFDVAWAAGEAAGHLGHAAAEMSEARRAGALGRDRVRERPAVSRASASTPSAERRPEAEVVVADSTDGATRAARRASAGRT